MSTTLFCPTCGNHTADTFVDVATHCHCCTVCATTLADTASPPGRGGSAGRPGVDTEPAQGATEADPTPGHDFHRELGRLVDTGPDWFTGMDPRLVPTLRYVADSTLGNGLGPALTAVLTIAGQRAGDSAAGVPAGSTVPGPRNEALPTQPTAGTRPAPRAGVGAPARVDRGGAMQRVPADGGARVLAQLRELTCGEAARPAAVARLGPDTSGSKPQQVVLTLAELIAPAVALPPHMVAPPVAVALTVISAAGWGRWTAPQATAWTDRSPYHAA